MLALAGGPQTKMITGGRKAEDGEPKEEESDKEEPTPPSHEELYKSNLKKAKAAITSLTAEISAMEMLKAQLEAIVDNERKKLKAAYLEQVCKLQTKLEESKKKHVHAFLGFPVKGSDLPPDNLEGKVNELAQASANHCCCPQRGQEAVGSHQEVGKQPFQLILPLQRLAHKSHLVHTFFVGHPPS